MRTIRTTVLALSLLAGGCAAVTSAIGGNTSDTGEAWYVKSTTIGPLVVSSKIFYCPAPANGPAQCREAKLINQPK
ncbi:MAG: hypothetical protein RMK29_01915 [Myxococcales bacterium]|nr:hypothetical protein [Myxococcota bacterium]MDW8280437.1 hypothetical protein [Myxococcales bacterium]